MDKSAFEQGHMLLIDKPLHWTSFGVVQKLRNIIRIKKIGHAGTLDPLATGLLILCTGKFTKKINEYMAQEKEYTGTFTIGSTTPTYDLESLPEKFRSFEHVTNEFIIDTSKKFIGEISQIPPAHSAIKIGGKRVYELARQGKEVKIEPRKITINQFDIQKIELPVIYFKVVCTTGTYIRSLAFDFGEALDCGAHLSSLRRTRIGNYSVDDAMTIENFENKFKADNIKD